MKKISAFALGNPDFWLSLRANEATFSQKHAQPSTELPHAGNALRIIRSKIRAKFWGEFLYE
jgi:hypothetical protein